MGDLAAETAVEPVGEGRYRAVLDEAWRIWGPMGGYVASFALRAAGAESRFERPASFSCHYLGVADFEAIDIDVHRLRAGRTAESFRVSIHQGSRPILEATIWTVDELEGLDHDDAVAPDVPGPEGLPTLAELAADRPPSPFPFWDNFDVAPLAWRADWPPPGPLDPIYRSWLRFRPTATFADPWVDGCRALIALDIQSWPSASPRHAFTWGEQPAWMAPSLDLYVAFHAPQPEADWLLADGCAPFGGDGLIGWNGRLWTAQRQLVATASGQMLCRRLTPA